MLLRRGHAHQTTNGILTLGGHKWFREFLNKINCLTNEFRTERAHLGYDLLSQIHVRGGVTYVCQSAPQPLVTGRVITLCSAKSPNHRSEVDDESVRALETASNQTASV